MNLTFLGATHEVTGSCFYLTAAGRHIVVDCGMEQGPDQYENQELPVSPAELDCVLLTHAHIDHSGLLPLLYRNGFRGAIHATDATVDLCGIMLRDSAHIQEFEAEWRNRKARRSGGSEFVPLYTMPDAVGAVELMVPHPYRERHTLYDGIDIRFNDVGHLLGSAAIEVWITEGEASRKVVFSGDIGNRNQPILRNPDTVDEADYVVIESTYGDSSHGPRPDYEAELARIMQRTFDRGGNVVIPSFAVGRTQEMLYFLRRIWQEKRVAGHDYAVYVDSPLAVEATNIFRENGADCYDEETLDLVRRGINPIGFAGLKVSLTSEDSKAINVDKSPKVILSASGMCEAGRIRHHLKHNLWRPESTILFVGYQAVGSTGRAILDGASEVRLFGETVEIKAEILRLAGTSAHADCEGLTQWLGAICPRPRRVFVVHGESSVCDRFAAHLGQLGYDAVAPYSGAAYDLVANAPLREPPPVPIRKEPAARASAAFDRLASAGQRLLAVIGRNRGVSNKDLARFTSQIDALCDKWDR